MVNNGMALLGAYIVALLCLSTIVPFRRRSA